MRTAILLLLTLLATPLRADLPRDLDAFARRALEVIGTPPGLTVAVVKDDRVVYRRDFGLRDVEAKLPVTPETRFYVASSTKAFTAMAALVLAAHGKLDLDAPVSTYWPALKLTPPLSAERLSLRELLAMRPGLANSTLNYRRAVVGNLEDDEQELLRVLATYSQDAPRTFQYSNMSYELAAEVLQRATGRTWQQLTAETVFEPLGMTATTSDVPPPGVPLAHLYRSTARGAFVRNAGKSNANIGPAGGTFMTSAVAAKWIVAMLNDGRAGERQLLPSRAVRAAQSWQTTQQRRFRWFDRWGWGLGQDLGDYEGDFLVHRFGGFNGAYSHISWMPDRRLGVAVFSNGGAGAADAIAAFAYDTLLGKPDLEAKWSAELVKLAAAAQQERDERRAADEKFATRGVPARPLAQYGGTYDYPRLGRAVVTHAGGRLWAQLGIMRSELVPAGGDDFMADWEGAGEIVTLTFAFDEQGRATRFAWGDRLFERVVSAP